MALFDLNRCTGRHLTSIPGIENTLADAIIRYRVNHKRYDHFEELWRVQGMNRCKFRLLKKHTHVGGERHVIIGGKMPNTRLTITDSMINIIKSKMKNNKTPRTSSPQADLLTKRKSRKKTPELVTGPQRNPTDNADSVASPPKICRSAPSPGRAKTPSPKHVRPVTCTAGQPSSLYSRYSPTGAAAVEVVGSRVPTPEKFETDVPKKTVVGNKRPEISLKPSPSGNKVNLWCTFDEKLLQHPATMTIKWNAGEGGHKMTETQPNGSHLDLEPKREGDLKKDKNETKLEPSKEINNQDKTNNTERLGPVGCDANKDKEDISNCEYKMGKMDVSAKTDDLPKRCDSLGNKNDPKIGVRSLLNCVTPDKPPVRGSISAPLSEENLLQFERILSTNTRRWWDKHRAIEGWVESVNNARNITSMPLPAREQKLPLRGRGMCRVKEAVPSRRPNYEKKDLISSKAKAEMKEDDKGSDARTPSPEARTCYRLLRRSMVRYEESNQRKSPMKKLKQKPGKNITQEREIIKVSPAPSVSFRHRINQKEGEKDHNVSEGENKPNTTSAVYQGVQRSQQNKSLNGPQVVMGPSFDEGQGKAIPASWKFKPHKFAILSPSSMKRSKVRNIYDFSDGRRAESDRLKSLYEKYNTRPKCSNKEELVAN